MAPLRQAPPRQTLASRHGIAAAEFALVAPVMILILLSIYDVGRAVWRTTQLETAARVGAQYAFANPTDSAGITSRVQASLPGWTGLTISPTTMACQCDNGTAANCTTGTCPVGAATVSPIGYITVTVTQPLRFISPLTAALFPAMATLRGSVALRFH
jgi:Flp pilus assembly protein TadG